MNLFSRPKIKLATQLVHQYHAGQTRKHTNIPYSVHPIAVAQLVSTIPDFSVSVEELVDITVAALLHDILEDTDIDPNIIRNNFGPKILLWVSQLTETKHPFSSRKRRKAWNLQRLANSSKEVQTIKLADIIDNLSSLHRIAHKDPEFARIYISEKEDQVKVLTNGNPSMWKQAKKTVETAKSLLGSS